jgi:hypothetical protein
VAREDGDADTVTADEALPSLAVLRAASRRCCANERRALWCAGRLAGFCGIDRPEPVRCAEEVSADYDKGRLAEVDGNLKVADEDLRAAEKH